MCRRTGDVMGDVLEADWPEGWYWEHSGEGWYSTGDRYAFAMHDDACSEHDHMHVPPTQDEIARSVAEAKKITTDLKAVYTAPTVDAADARWLEFVEQWGGRYPEDHRAVGTIVGAVHAVSGLPRRAPQAHLHNG